MPVVERIVEKIEEKHPKFIDKQTIFYVETIETY